MRSLIVGICLLACFSVPRDSDAQKLKLLAGEWAPYVSETMTNYGFTAEVVSYAFLASGIETEITFTSWENCEKMIANGKFFGSFPLSRTIERQSFADFSEPIAWSKGILFFMKEKIKNLDFETVGDLKEYAIGGVRGYYYVPMFKRAELQVNYSSTTEIAFKKLYLGQVDIVPENEFVGWSTIEKLFPDEMWRFGSSHKALNEDTLHLMVSKKYRDSADLLKRFNEGLKIIMSNGIYRNLLKKYIKHTDIKIPSTGPF